MGLLVPLGLPSLLLALLALAGTAPLALAGGYPQRPIDLAETKLFELGVSDYDGDGLLDPFTLNHTFPSSLLHNDGDWSFHEASAAAGLSPTAEVARRLNDFERLYNEVAEPFGWKFTREKMDEWLARLKRSAPAAVA